MCTAGTALDILAKDLLLQKVAVATNMGSEISSWRLSQCGVVARVFS